MRIVSLLPSATEIVLELGLEEALVGVSHECSLPAGLSTLPIVSRSRIDPDIPGSRIDRDVRTLLADGLSLFEIDTELLAALRPDLVITQDHCEVCAVPLSTVEAALRSLVGRRTAICTLHPSSLSEVVDDFERVAAAVGQPAAGRATAERFRARLSALEARTVHLDRPTVALVEWLEPPMIAGGWMPELAAYAGLEPLLVTGPDRFATVGWPDIVAADPDWLLLLACGFDVERTLKEIAGPELRTELDSVPAVAAGRWAVLDGDVYFNRPGPKLADSAELLAAVVHQELGRELHRYVGSFSRPKAAGSNQRSTSNPLGTRSGT